MKSASNSLLAVAIAAFALVAAVSCDSREQQTVVSSPAASDAMRIAALRDAAIANGFVPAAELELPTLPARVAAGKLIFESPKMSINGEISCQDCHLSEFGSADGLPNAIGVGGSGKGADRLNSGGRILPRNALPFWGRGGKGFTTFFWDGKVTVNGDEVVSQYGHAAPSTDPLKVAVHLPSVELHEMVADTQEARNAFVSEDVQAADTIQATLSERFRTDPKIGPLLMLAYPDQSGSITFDHIADALTHFIRHEFRIRETAFETFVFGEGQISEDQLAGGILFYGRGRCAACHSGPYFSDFDFHSVAFPQAGFGKNGFGIDEGRYNVTLDPKDRFLFRTPPLYNVTMTAPYSHSGSVVTLDDAIIAHFDPLRLIDTENMNVRERSDLFARLGPASRETLPSALTDEEVSQLAAFLRMLEFEM